MLKLPVLKESDLDFYRGKSVVLYGMTREAKTIYAILQAYEIPVVAICDAIGTRLRKYQGIPVVPYQQINEYILQHSSVLIQPAVDDDVAIERMHQHLHGCNVMVADVSADQLITSFQYVLYRKICNNPRQLQKAHVVWMMKYRRTTNIELIGLLLRRVKHPIFVCLPMKTADHTLYHTFDAINLAAKDKKCRNPIDIGAMRGKEGIGAKLVKALYYLIESFDRTPRPIEYANIVHRPSAFRKTKFQKKYQTVRVITAVREPISQNLSGLYQGLLSIDWVLGAIEGQSEQERVQTMDALYTVFMTQGGDVDKRFQAYLERYVYPQRNGELIADPIRAIQDFIPRFNQSVVSLYAYPFNKEKGYSIIKEGNLEVFVYQLEKLNDIVSQLSDWIGVPFDQLINGNVSTDKWIGDSYKQAQKEIVITQEYFDRCFDEPYVKHFYSEADIEKFKAKWRGHIK